MKWAEKNLSNTGLFLFCPSEIKSNLCYSRAMSYTEIMVSKVWGQKQAAVVGIKWVKRVSLCNAGSHKTLTLQHWSLRYFDCYLDSIWFPQKIPREKLVSSRKLQILDMIISCILHVALPVRVTLFRYLCAQTLLKDTHCLKIIEQLLILQHKWKIIRTH